MAGRGRLKRAVRDAIHICGGVDGAAATAERSRSVAGDWNNLSHAAFPPLDCAMAIDEIAVSRGMLPPITTALAREMGGVFVPHIDAIADEGTLSGMVMRLSKELGDLAGSMAQALADGDINSTEAEGSLKELEDMSRLIAQLRGQLETIRDGNPAGIRTHV